MSQPTKRKRSPYFTGTVKSVLSVINNPIIQLPITIVINGDWGSGKSSLMNNVQGALDDENKEYHKITVTTWFNAWHMQSEENLIDEFMVSLVKAYETKRNWWFRPALFRRRLVKMSFARQFLFWLTTGLLVPAFSMLLVHIITPVSTFYTSSIKSHLWPVIANILRSYWCAWSSILSGVINHSNAATSILSLLGTLLPVILSFVFVQKQLMPSGLAVLNELVPTESLKVSSELKPLGYREKFKEDFWDLMEAVGHQKRFVVFIDDLDRISGQKILELLEAIDFIRDTASMPRKSKGNPANIIFVLGMATGVVAKNLGAELQKISPDALDTRNRGMLYIEKLMNVVIPVPDTEAEEQFFRQTGV